MRTSSPIKTEVITKDGECRIFIELTININASGVVQSVSAEAKQQQEEQEKTNWAIPDFSSKEKVKFGKKE